MTNLVTPVTYAMVYAGFAGLLQAKPGKDQALLGNCWANKAKSTEN